MTNQSELVPPIEALFVYHGTYIDNLGSILRDGALKPSVTKLKPSDKSVVHLSFQFSKASNYGDVIFEIPFSRIVGNIGRGRTVFSLLLLRRCCGYIGSGYRQQCRTGPRR